MYTMNTRLPSTLGNLALELVALLAAVPHAVVTRQLAITAALVDVALLAVQIAVTAEETVGDTGALAGGLDAVTGSELSISVGTGDGEGGESSRDGEDDGELHGE